MKHVVYFANCQNSSLVAAKGRGLERHGRTFSLAKMPQILDVASHIALHAQPNEPTEKGHGLRLHLRTGVNLCS